MHNILLISIGLLSGYIFGFSYREITLKVSSHQYFAVYALYPIFIVGYIILYFIVEK